MPSKLDLKNQRFGKLMVLDEAAPVYYGNQKQTMWNCQCDCGRKVVVSTGRLRSGNTRSCGCLSREISSKIHIKDLTGQRFGRLTATRRIGSQMSNSKTRYECLCDCGRLTIVEGSNLIEGVTSSCGCLRKELASKTATKHGCSHKDRLYRVWIGMKERCSNPNHISYQFYGARGVAVCKEWVDSYETFKTWAYQHGYDETAPRGICTLDRIDVDGPYAPDNCRWVDMHTQNANKQNHKLSK